MWLSTNGAVNTFKSLDWKRAFAGLPWLQRPRCVRRGPQADLLRRGSACYRRRGARLLPSSGRQVPQALLRQISQPRENAEFILAHSRSTRLQVRNSLKIEYVLFLVPLVNGTTGTNGTNGSNGFNGINGWFSLKKIVRNGSTSPAPTMKLLL